MAKTDFSNGTVVTPEFLDSIFAHDHNGQDDDGHASRINLTNAAHVQGVLPLANVAVPSTGNITDASQYAAASLTAALNTIKSQLDPLPGHVHSASVITDNSQFNQTNVGNALNVIYSALQALAADVTDASGIIELTGFSSNQNVNFFAMFVRHRSADNTITEVLLYLPEVLATSNGSTMSIADASIPSALRPSYQTSHKVPCVVSDAGVMVGGIITVTATGDWVITKADGTAFNTSGSKGLGRQMVRYMGNFES